MADVLLSSLVSVILGNLNSNALEEFGIACGLKSKLKNLKSTFTTIQAVIHDAEKEQWKSEAVKNWLRKLKHAAYDVEDVLDKFATEALRRREQNDVGNQVRNFFSHRNPFVFRLKMGHKLKNVNDKLAAIADEKSKFHFREGARDVEVHDIIGLPTSSLVNESETLGRDEDKKKIIKMLLTDCAEQADVSVYAIYGLGGVGKTTLAQLAYNDESVKTVFELRIWVCVSVDFDIIKLTKAILESMERSPCHIQELDPLQQHLQEKLSGKRFLLVLDDVWNEDSEKWDRLKEVLRCGAKGSVVIVTTRDERVARIMTPFSTHPLGFLSDDDSWSLFKQRAFGREDYTHLEAIGKEIVKKCGGLPLAIKALGSLMRLKSRESEWLSVKSSDIWDLTGEASKIIPALRLSYNHMPPYLRQCFAYCSIFPKDYDLEKDTLIELWMANGFIPSTGRMDLHDMGHEIFNELVWRSLLQEIYEDDLGNIGCKMHDLVHDLAQCITQYECIMIDDQPSRLSEMPEQVRHLSIPCNISQDILHVENTLKIQSLRSVILLDQVVGSWDWGNTLFPYFSDKKCLRALDLRRYKLEKLPGQIGNLKLLRYLDISDSLIKSLPESICGLRNLQTLKLNECYDLCELPKGMRHMRNLTYLYIHGCWSLRCMPAGMGQLTHLKRLSTFIVGKDHGHCINELERLNLIGELSIVKLDNVKNLTDAKSANLIGKRLQSLCLFWGEENKGNLSENVEEVLGGLQPNSSLEKLHIRNYQGSRFPDWMMNLLLPKLVDVRLECKRCERLPPLGKLNFLKMLTIFGMDALKSFDNDCYVDGVNLFPSLERVYISSMPNLEDWKILNAGEHFPRLRELSIYDCPKFVELPILPSLKDLDIRKSNDMLFRSLVNFTSLTNLRVDRIPESTIGPLTEGVEPYLTALENLDIVGCPGLNSSLGDFQHLPALRRLSIGPSRSIYSLPNEIGHLTLLSDLQIWNCTDLMSLPEGLRSLTTLKSLTIHACRHLESRCEKEKGEDWEKIAHIPTILINGKYIQNLDC